MALLRVSILATAGDAYVRAASWARLKHTTHARVGRESIADLEAFVSSEAVHHQVQPTYSLLRLRQVVSHPAYRAGALARGSPPEQDVLLSSPA
jgi:hypothetical protein